MAKKAQASSRIQTALRLPPEAYKRADALLPKVAKGANVAAFGQLTRTAILRLAVMRGLDVLEKEYK